MATLGSVTTRSSFAISRDIGSTQLLEVAVVLGRHPFRKSLYLFRDEGIFCTDIFPSDNVVTQSAKSALGYPLCPSTFTCPDGPGLSTRKNETGNHLVCADIHAFPAPY